MNFKRIPSRLVAPIALAFGVPVALFGCAGGEDFGRSSSSLELDYRADVKDPVAPDLPDCWWASDPSECSAGCWGTAGGSTAAFERLRGELQSSQGSTTTLTGVAAGADAGAPESGENRRQTTGGTGDLVNPECPTPNGVVACPHCSRWDSNPSYGLFGVYAAEDAMVGSVVAITDGSGAYEVREIDELVVTQPVVTSPEGYPVRYVTVNLKGGTLQDSSGVVDLSDTVFLQMVIEGGVEPVPTPYWLACPSDGGACERTFDL